MLSHDVTLISALVMIIVNNNNNNSNVCVRVSLKHDGTVKMANLPVLSVCDRRDTDRQTGQTVPSVTDDCSRRL